MARVLQRCVILASFVFRECTHQRVQRAPVLLEVFGALRGRAGEIDRYEERFATSSRGSCIAVMIATAIARLFSKTRMGKQNILQLRSNAYTNER